MASNFAFKKVKELQSYLKERGVTFSNLKKPALEELCILAQEIGLSVDPDSIEEDREEVLSSKLKLENGSQLENPQKLNGDTNLVPLPPLSIFDIYTFCLDFQDYHHKDFRQYHKMEAYTMALDGYVMSVKVCPYPNMQDYCAVRATVKPRTRSGMHIGFG